MKFSIIDFLSKCEQIYTQPPADFFTFTKETLNGKPDFLCR